MNIATEYLTRRKLKRQLFETPCSLILIGSEFNNRGKIIVVNFEDYNDKKYIIKRWNVYDASPEFILPPMKEFIVSKKIIFNKIISKFKPLPFINYKIPNKKNHYYQPMSDRVYLHYHDECLDNLRHRYRRIEFIWKAFCDTYLPEFSYSAYPSQNQVKLNYPKYWKYWTKWKKYLLKHKGAAPELVFKD